MHYEVHDSSGTPLLQSPGGLFDIHQQFDELLPLARAKPTFKLAEHAADEVISTEFGIVAS